MKNIFILNCIIILFGYGCKKDSSVNNQTTLLANKWLLSSIQDTKTNVMTDYPAEVQQTWGFENIVFNDSLKTVDLKGLCNGGSGPFPTFSGTDSIKFHGLSMTLKYCKYEEWETYLWDNLDSAYKYKINANSLIIYSKGSYNLYFNKFQNQQK